MATNVLMPLSPASPSSNPGIRGQLTGKVIRSSARAQKSGGPSAKGSLTKKALSSSDPRASAPPAQESKKTATVSRGIDPQSYRNSILHNTCIELLEDGFHKSFSELFQLVEEQRLDHVRAGPAAILLEPLIEHDATKLDQLKQKLMSAEAALQTGDMAAVYMAQQRLAQYFEQSKDSWLSDHFYQRCLETGRMVEGDNRRKEGEAHCHVGLALENRGSLEEAMEHFETFHQLAVKYKWFTDNGEELSKISCEHLRRVYTKVAEQVHAESTQDAITFLKKAYEIAKEGGDTYQEGLASYRLGNAYESIREHDLAIKYHKGYLERCKHYGDEAGVGSAYEALSISFESKGDTENAVKFLEMFVDVSEKAELKSSLAKACSAIGIMHNTLGNYERAVSYFDRCYQLCNELGDREALHLARVHYGVARSHQLMGNYSGLLHKQSSQGLQQLVSWKDTRTISHDDDPLTNEPD